jgi:hypothetical protein
MCVKPTSIASFVVPFSSPKDVGVIYRSRHQGPWSMNPPKTFCLRSIPGIPGIRRCPGAHVLYSSPWIETLSWVLRWLPPVRGCWRREEGRPCCRLVSDAQENILVSVQTRTQDDFTHAAYGCTRLVTAKAAAVDVLETVFVMRLPPAGRDPNAAGELIKN